MIYNILEITLIQVCLSTILSLAIGIVLARILFYNPKPWTDKVLALPLIIPSLSLVVGVTTLMGKTVHYLYGLQGIVMCHIYLNVPLATLILLNAYRSIPQSLWQLTAALRLSKMVCFLKVELPLLKTALSKTAGIVFLYCLSSFTIPLMMGGGPGGNTLTVALYYALVVKGDFQESMVLLAVNVLIGFLVILISSHYKIADIKASTGQQRIAVRSTNISWLIDKIFTSFIFVFLLAPLWALMWQQSWSTTPWSMQYTQAITGSLTIAGITAGITTLITLGICCLQPLARIWLERLSSLMITIPSFAIGMGILWLHIHSHLFAVSPFTILITTTVLVSWPVSLRIVHGAFLKIEANNHQLMRALHLPWKARLRWVYLPLAWPTMRLAFALVAVYSLGDLGSILCFPSQDIQTLPKMIYEAHSQFNFMTAQFLSLVLIGLATSIFIIFNSRDQYA